jgi:hypothetical protein
VTHATAANLETCSSPKPCCQPAEMELRHALVEDGTIYGIIHLGYCLEHGTTYADER